MNPDLADLADLPVGLLVALGVLVVVEMALLVIALLAWARTPETHMPPPNRWVWLALILFLQILGPIAFLIARRGRARAVGESNDEPTPPARRAARQRADDTVDLLYGDREDGK